MAVRARLTSLLLPLLCACPGSPVEAESESATEGSSGPNSGETLSTSATLTTTSGMSATTMSSDSLDSSTGPSTTDPSTTQSTSDPSSTDTDATTDPSATDTTDATTTDATTTGDPSLGTSESSSSEGPPECVGDEGALHQDPFSALDLAGLDCDDAALAGAGVIDAATWQDWWRFPGSDISGCEPDTVRIEVTAGGPLPICAYATPCAASCSVGMADIYGGCCGTDQVQFSVSCIGDDDSATVSILFGDGTEVCQDFTFEYEF